MTNIIASLVICIVTNWGDMKEQTTCYATYPVTYETTYSRVGMVCEQRKLVYTVDGDKYEQVLKEKLIRVIYLDGIKDDKIIWNKTNEVPVVDFSDGRRMSNTIWNLGSQ